MSTYSKESLDQHIGRTVHGLIWERRITQRRLATHLGLDETMVSKLLRGRRTWSVMELCATAEFLGVSVPDLLPTTSATQWGSSISGATHTTGWYQRSAAQQGHTEHTRMPAPQRTHLLNGARNRAEATVIRFPVAV